MAEFSKQWAEVNDPDFPWDFDIDQEFETIPHGYYKFMICEGFGFLAIERDVDGTEYLLFEGKGDILERKNYRKFILEQRKKIS